MARRVGGFAVVAMVGAVCAVCAIVAVTLTVGRHSSTRSGSGASGSTALAAGSTSTSASTSTPAQPIALPACIDPNPGPTRPVSGPAGADVSEGRVVHNLILDDGAFQLAPPPVGVQPAVSASLARCTLLAADTAQNFAALAAADENGFSFGLAQVTVADSMLSGHSTFDGVSGTGLPKPPPIAGPYHDRLMWIAVVEPLIAVPCPALPPGSAAMSEPVVSDPPGYQVLAIDATSGLAGIGYSARTAPPCGGTGLTAAYLDPLVEQVSVPWTLVALDPDGRGAVISVRVRSCDGSDGAWLPEDHPDLVTVTIARPIADCGSAQPRQLALHSATTTAALPATLRHGPIGAEDVAPVT